MPRSLFTASLSFAAMVCLISTASAAVTYGVSASGQAVTSVTGATPIDQSYTTSAFLQQTSYSQAANYSAQSGSGALSANASVVQQTSSYGQLHESTSASASGSGSSATASAYLGWLDTITFTGAPVGTNIVVQLTNVYDGTFSISGNIGAGTGVQESASLTGSSANINLVNSYSTAQNLNVTQVNTLNTTVGSSLQLEEQLIEYLSGTGTFAGSADFSNTEAVYLSVLTPGVSIVSASGADYSQPSANPTPEPSAFLLVAGGIAALCALRKRRA